MNKQKKKFFILAGLLITFMLGCIFGSPSFFNVGNPISAYAGIVKLAFTEEDIVKISSNPDRYIGNINKGNDPIHALLYEDGWEFYYHAVADMDGGLGTVFSKGEDLLGIKTIRFTRKHQVWEVTYNTEKE
jgi:hypothetical protein